MGYVRLRPDLNARVAETFGGKVTRPHALKVQARAKALADMRAKHSSVADRININVHAHGSHTSVVMSVTGRNGSQIASYLEYGYFNLRAQRHLPGMYVMSEAKYG